MGKGGWCVFGGGHVVGSSGREVWKPRRGEHLLALKFIVGVRVGSIGSSVCHIVQLFVSLVFSSGGAWGGKIVVAGIRALDALYRKRVSVVPGRGFDLRSSMLNSCQPRPFRNRVGQFAGLCTLQCGLGRQSDDRGRNVSGPRGIGW